MRETHTFRYPGLNALPLLLLAALCAHARTFHETPAGRAPGDPPQAEASAQPSGSRAGELEEELRKALAEIERLKEQLGTLEEKIGGLVQQWALAQQKVESAETRTKELKEHTEGIATSVRKFPIKLYGTILVNAAHNSRAIFPLDVPVFAPPRSSPRAINVRTFAATARQTRLGAQYEAKAGTAKLTGTFEFDLFGGFAEIPSGVGFNLFRLRKASARLDFAKTSFVIGQDFTVFSPLVPRSFSGFAVHTLGGSGELIANRPSLVRIERRVEWGQQGKLLFAGELSDPNIGDLAQFDPVRRAGSGERSGQPAYVARVALSRTVQAKEATLGFAGRYNRQVVIGAGFEQPIDGYGVEMDWVFPVSQKVTFRGELFRGRSLAIFFGGIFQGVTLLPGGGARGITSSGGWAELNYDLSSKWAFNGAFGVDDPRSCDLLLGMRARNQSFFVNAMYKLTPAVTWMVEYHRIRTDYQNQPFNNTAVNIFNSSWAFTF